MSDAVNEVKDIAEKLTPENQHILLRYVLIADAAEKSARKSSNASSCTETGTKGKVDG